MKCPYCGQRTNDMPKHLKENRWGCHTKHEEALRQQLGNCLMVAQKLKCGTCGGEGVIDSGAKGVDMGNCQRVGEILRPLVGRIGKVKDGTLDVGNREKSGFRRGLRRLSPTNSERLNRSLVELSPSAFKIHTLLWQWRGAPAKGGLPFFTVHGLGKFCGLTRPTVRRGLRELESKGWVRKGGYNCHYKNELYRLIAVREVPRPDVD